VNLIEIAASAIALAKEWGATDSECTISEGSHFETVVRMGEVENIKDAGSRAAGIRVLEGTRAGSAYTSDLSQEGIRHMVRSAIEIAAIASEDPMAGLPDDGDFGQLSGDLGLYHEDTANVPAGDRIERAKLAERAALDADPRITNSEGGSFDSSAGRRVFANSRGFMGEYRYSSCSLTAQPVAKDNGAMERDYWSSSARSVEKLESPEAVGKQAAARVLRRLNPRKVATQRCPVIFEQRVARSIASHIFDAVNGTSVYRKSSFLAGKLGEKVASDCLTVIDDATIPGLFGTSPFDDEGVPSRRTVVIENGVLKSYLLNTYTAKKLGLKTTGNASRGVAGNAGVGHGNLYIEKGSKSPEELIAGVKSGFYVTELIGHGVNALTGDYSRGAFGIWIENGKLTFPVSEVTIAGNLRDMLLSLEATGSDLEFRGAVASPTLLIREMTLSGQ
jgi:PmbA protein